MPNLNASLGVSQIPFLKKLIEKKRIIADKYDSSFSAVKHFDVMPRKMGSKLMLALFICNLNQLKKAKSFTEYLLK